MRFPSFRPFLLLILMLGTPLAAHAADPQPYRVDLASTGDDALDATLRATSDLLALRDGAPVSPFGLIARSRSDVDRLKTVVESYGYYDSTVTLQIEGMGLNHAGLADALTALPKDTEARVSVAFALGPLYHLRNVKLDGDVPEAALPSFTLKEGAPAVAADVLAAGARLQTVLQEQGFAFAKVDPPVAYEDQTQPVLDVSFHVVTGQRVTIGEVRLEGLKRVHEKLVRRRLIIHTGQPYNPNAIEAARRDLQTLGAFAAISVKLGQAADATGGVPVTFVLRERARHLVTFSAGYSSDLGGSGGVSWTDRNVLGNADQLKLSATVINLGGGSASTGAGYDTSAKYTTPDFGHRDQSLQFTVGALKQSLQAYDQKALTSSVTLNRKLSTVWSASAGIAASDEQITQEQSHRNYTLIAVPLAVTYDSTNLPSPLDDPTHGMRNLLSVTPTLALGHPDAYFVISKIQMSAYFDLHELGLTNPGRSVVAVRAFAGQAIGAGQFSLPPDQRFYGGGSGTIRGYRYQGVGPQFCIQDGVAVPSDVRHQPLPSPPAGACKPDGNPVGGTALVAGTLEFRQRFATNFGGAVFVDAGQVSASLKPLPTDVRVGAGFGVRYYTPIGPIRFDVAVPVPHRQGDDAFEIYIGLGQGF